MSKLHLLFEATISRLSFKISHVELKMIWNEIVPAVTTFSGLVEKQKIVDNSLFCVVVMVATHKYNLGL